MKGGDDKNFSIHLKEPFPLLIDALAKISSLAPFIMPERLAKTDPYQQVTEMVGSGPFKFVKEEHQPGNKVVYVKNTDYVPRSEPADWASGGKVVKVDRVEWHRRARRRRRRLRHCKTARPTGGRTRRPMSGRSSHANTDIYMVPASIRSALRLCSLQLALSAVRQRQRCARP